MTLSFWTKTLVIVIACGVMGGAGCSRKNKHIDGLGGMDTVEPGDVPLGERFEISAKRIPDARFAPVKFRYDSYRVASTEVYKIEAVADYLRRHPRVRMVTEGHCDERGSREYNISLAENRAQSVRANLVKMGIGPMRIQTRSYGEEKPLNPGHSESAWRANRRVEFVAYR